MKLPPAPRIPLTKEETVSRLVAELMGETSSARAELIRRAIAETSEREETAMVYEEDIKWWLDTLVTFG